MNIHTEFNKDIKFLAKSEIRLKILSELNNHPNNVRGIVKNTKITYSSVSSNISKLEQNNHIKKIKNKYYINPMSEIYFKTLMDFKNSADLISDYESFWGKHNINQLNIESINNINDLKDSKLIETTPIDIYKTHNTIKKQLIETNSLKAIFPYMHPDYPQLIENILKNEGHVELIMPKDIYRAIMTHITRQVRRDALRQNRLEVDIVKKNPQLYLTICDESMSLGLFKNDGSFDQNRILISDNEKSQDWALNLFEDIKNEVTE
ncbi:ArsR family transcriptional regulator [Methanobrevibacter sp. YE315]|uniref:helix-turn-helix transcriptional regulator n=1 Tax=Methanobrevibacter sp. YE315 TaxID=1609968 RepID=UPI000764E787|nr:transcriptional regulator FilR1 domain-containing protein [Methanobrevibacter sp. YE315]AMD17929.1 ArsR family transcriptional regulator [Methanobrevibacter sp. YE315]